MFEESGTRILVGTRALFEEHGVPVPANALSEVAGARWRGSKLSCWSDVNSRVLGTVTLADQLRAEAKKAVQDLKAQGYRTILLTGDSSDAAKAIGNELRRR